MNNKNIAAAPPPPAEQASGDIEAVAALLYTEATDEPWTVAGVEHPLLDRGYYRDLAQRVIAALSQRPVVELSDAQCDAIYQAVSMSNLTRDVKTPERKRQVVRDAALAPQQPEKGEG